MPKRMIWTVPLRGHMTDETSATVEHICPNCEFFYLHGKSEWEDHPKCTDCSHRGGMVDNWKERAQGGA